MPWCTRHAYHIYMGHYDPEAFGGHTRDEFLAALRAEGIPVSSGYGMLLSEQASLRMVAEKYPDRIRTLLEDPDGARAMGLEGRRLVEERFPIDRMVGEVVGVGSKVAGGLPGPTST